MYEANKQTLNILYEQLYQNPPFAWFPTPPKLIDKMIRLAKIKPGTTALEPTAGDGKIAEKLKDAGAIVDVIEYDPLLQQILFQKGFNLVGTDRKSGEFEGVARKPLSFMHGDKCHPLK